MTIMISFLKSMILIVPVLLSVAFITLSERKVLSLIMIRQGPNKVSMQGILQPIADAMKLANKNVNTLSNFSTSFYYMSVLMMFCMSMFLWSCMMNFSKCVSWKFSFLVVMAILGVMSMKSILSGWSTFGKYSLIGSMRTVSQMISYESVIYLIILMLIWISKDFSMDVISLQEYNLTIMSLPIIFMIWLVAVLAELNRTPYDFSEGESELVSGFNTEFGSGGFTLIFLSEYSNIIFFMTLTTLIFFQTGHMMLMMIYVFLMLFLVIWIRSALPRMRFDKFMMKAWKFYIPLTTIMLMMFILLL